MIISEFIKSKASIAVKPNQEYTPIAYRYFDAVGFDCDKPLVFMIQTQTKDIPNALKKDMKLFFSAYCGKKELIPPTYVGIESSMYGNPIVDLLKKTLYPNHKMDDALEYVTGSDWIPFNANSSSKDYYGVGSAVEIWRDKVLPTLFPWEE